MEYKKGDHVRIVKGSFSGYIGYIEDILDNGSLFQVKVPFSGGINFYLCGFDDLQKSDPSPGSFIPLCSNIYDRQSFEKYVQESISMAGPFARAMTVIPHATHKVLSPSIFSVDGPNIKLNQNN
jgi:hypothetical protein